jgi:hypothetical protein
MIQFNLLPDVKIAFIKAERQKRLIVSISTIVSIAAIIIFVLLFTFVNLAQKKNMNDLTKDIKTQSDKLMDTEDLNKILTVQNQLGALDTMHTQKIMANRLFPYIQQVTPAQVSITQLDVDFAANTMSVTGKADSLAAVNIYTDSLKFTNYNVEGETEDIKPAFSDVVLASFGRNDNTNTYNITFSFDPAIFAQDKTVVLQLPQMNTSQSNIGRPDANTLFEVPEN